MERPYENTSLEDLQLGFLFDEGENTSLEDLQLDFLFDEGNHQLDFLNQFSPHQDVLLPEETRQIENEVPGSEVESDGYRAGRMQSQMRRSRNISESTVIAQSIQSTDTNSELDAASERQKQRKRKIDRAYRERQKAIKQKQEEEVQSLRQENAKLQQELEAAKQKADKLKSKSIGQINDAEECRIVFELNSPDEDAKRRLMMVAGGFPGITSLKMDTQRKRMTLEGIDIDPLPLRDKLKNICNTKLISFNIMQSKKDEKKEPIKEDVTKFKSYKAYSPLMDPYPRSQGPGYAHEFAEVYGATSTPRFSFENSLPYQARMNPYPRPEGPRYAHEFAEVYGATSTPRFSFENAATIFLLILLLLLLIRPAIYNDVLVRFVNLFATFFEAVGQGVRRGQVLICDKFFLLCN